MTWVIDYREQSRFQDFEGRQVRVAGEPYEPDGQHLIDSNTSDTCAFRPSSCAARLARRTSTAHGHSPTVFEPAPVADANAWPRDFNGATTMPPGVQVVEYVEALHGTL